MTAATIGRPFSSRMTNTTSDPDAFRTVLGTLLDAEFAALADVRPAAWDGDRLRAVRG